MAAASIYNNQKPADEYYRAPSPTSSLSPTLVNEVDYTKLRPSLKLGFRVRVSSAGSQAGGASNSVLNSTVINAARQTLYSIASTSKRTTMVSCKGKDNVEVATVLWDRHSPQMVFRRKKMKCKEWLKHTRANNPDNDSRILTHGDVQLTLMHGQGYGQLIPANRPTSLAIARWQVKTGGDDLVILEISQETPVESSLLDSIVLSVVLLQSGYSLGDSHALFPTGPTFGIL